MNPQVSQAFDRHAPHYTVVWDALPQVRWLRARVIAQILSHLKGPSNVLDLGCGPGSDGVLLHAAGHQVVGLDASPQMVAQARARGVEAHVADLGRPETWPDVAGFDIAFSDFAALNCLSDLRATAQGLSTRLKPGAPVVLVSLGRWCPAERWFRLKQRRWGPALRGRHSGTLNVEGVPVPVFMHSTDAIAAMMGRRIVHKEALGLFSPPPNLFPALPSWAAYEPWVAQWPILRHLGDHTLLVLKD